MKKQIISAFLAGAIFVSSSISANAVTARDALQLLKRITSQSTTPADDYNGDGKVTAKDVLAMLKDVTGAKSDPRAYSRMDRIHRSHRGHLRS